METAKAASSPLAAIASGVGGKLVFGIVRGQRQVIYPSVRSEWMDISMLDKYTVYAIPECEDYQVLVSEDPKGQHKVLCLHQKRRLVKGEYYWEPIKPNMHTGPTIRGFKTEMHAMMHAHTWLLARVKGKESAEQQKMEFMKAKGIKPKGAL